MVKFENLEAPVRARGFRKSKVSAAPRTIDVTLPKIFGEASPSLTRGRATMACEKDGDTRPHLIRGLGQSTLLGRGRSPLGHNREQSLALGIPGVRDEAPIQIRVESLAAARLQSCQPRLIGVMRASRSTSSKKRLRTTSSSDALQSDISVPRWSSRPPRL